MESQTGQGETKPSAAPPNPAITSCRRKKKEDATFLEDLKYHIDEFINASMEEHKSCAAKTVRKVIFRITLNLLHSLKSLCQIWLGL